MNRNYYEAILQIRPADSRVFEFAVKRVNGTGTVRLVKVVKTKRGPDVYLSSWKFAVALGRELARLFGGKVQVSRKIFGKSRKTGKTVYRSSVLLRLPWCKVGDVVGNSTDAFIITSLKKKIIGRNLLTGKKSSVEGDGFSVLDVVDAEVSKTTPHLEVIHPHNYQSIPVANQATQVKTDQKRVKVALEGGKIWLVR